MTDINITRQLHRLLDKVADSQVLDSCDIAHLRATLPDLPKQKTLEELRREVYDVWAGTNGNEWPDDVHGGLETWLDELHTQLQGLKCEAVPGLPAGMRLAEHADYGRVVVSPSVDLGDNEIYYLDSDQISGADLAFVTPDSLTFIDAEPVHPEFLETEADYAAAPEGTIVAMRSRLAWVKEGAKDWTCRGGSNSDYSMALNGRRRVWRWGDK